MNRRKVSAIERQTFEDAIELHGDTVTRILLLRCQQPQDAEDCFQAVFLKLLTCRKKFKDQEHIKAWLIRTAINEAVSANRQFWKRRVTLLGDTPFPEEIAPPDSDRLELLEEIRSLPEQQREVLYLHYYEGFTVTEIAEMLKVRPGTVDSRLGRARAALKLRLEEG